MGMAEQIRVLLVKEGNISEAELARRLGYTPANLNQKMKRDNFAEKELRRIAELMDCDLKLYFVRRKTGEEI
jgi:transcriptional regulator